MHNTENIVFLYETLKKIKKTDIILYIAVKTIGGNMKKIICFIGELFVDFQAEIAQYFSDHFAENNCEITFMVNFDALVANVLYGEIEKKIMHIPNLNNYDGIIICPDTYAIPGMEEELAFFLMKNAECPVVSLRVRDDRFYSITLGDYDAICQMTEHFIVKHGMKRVCFMTGRMELEDARVRLQAYKDTMAKHGIEVTEGMVFYGNYWRKKGVQAVEWFLSQNKELPQAIVCSNDYMAISVCNALRAKGYRIPDDIAVSGLDDIDEVRYHIPPITSIRASVSSMCSKAMEVLKNIWDGKPQDKQIVIPLEPVYRNSCGCNTEINMQDFRDIYLEKESLQLVLAYTPYLPLDFENADDFDELITSIYLKLSNKSFGTQDDFGILYFCMCDESERHDFQLEKNLSYTDNMHLKAIITSKGIKRCSCRFNRHEILPREYIVSYSPLFVFTLHCKDYCYGYLVMQNADISRFKDLIKPLVFAIGSSLDRIRMYSENKNVQTLREQSYIDELTGIPNRRSMERYIRKMFEQLQHTSQTFCIVSVDLDGLKYINDTYGHLEGDASIKAAAKILDASKPESGIAVRTGGDEFVVMFLSNCENDAVTFIDTINEKVRVNNLQWHKPYELSMSAGYEYCHKNTDILLSMHKADNKMYAVKKAKKKNRID